eukprot:1054833-Amphidinium_carterae.1
MEWFLRRSEQSDCSYQEELRESAKIEHRLQEDMLDLEEKAHDSWLVQEETLQRVWDLESEVSELECSRAVPQISDEPQFSITCDKVKSWYGEKPPPPSAEAYAHLTPSFEKHQWSQWFPNQNPAMSEEAAPQKPQEVTSPPGLRRIVGGVLGPASGSNLPSEACRNEELGFSASRPASRFPDHGYPGDPGFPGGGPSGTGFGNGFQDHRPGGPPGGPGGDGVGGSVQSGGKSYQSQLRRDRRKLPALHLTRDVTAMVKMFEAWLVQMALSLGTWTEDGHSGLNDLVDRTRSIHSSWSRLSPTERSAAVNYTNLAFGRIRVEPPSTTLEAALRAELLE